MLTRYRETVSKNNLRPVRCIVKNSKIELNQVLMLANGSGSRDTSPTKHLCNTTHRSCSLLLKGNLAKKNSDHDIIIIFNIEL